MEPVSEQPEVQPETWAAPTTPPSPAPKRKWYRRRPFIAGVIVFVLIGIAVANNSSASTKRVTPAAPPITVVATTEAPASDVSISDFSIELVVLENQCFDTAGALVTVKPMLNTLTGHYDGQATLVYEVHGGEAVETYNIEVDGDNYTTSKLHIQTPTCNVNLTAEPTMLIPT